MSAMVSLCIPRQTNNRLIAWRFWILSVWRGFSRKLNIPIYSWRVGRAGVFLTATVEGLVRLSGEGDCLNWKDFLDWIMFDNLYYFNRGRTIWSGGKGWGSGAVYGWFGLGKKIFFLNLYLVIEFFADTQRCEIFFQHYKPWKIYFFSV